MLIKYDRLNSLWGIVSNVDWGSQRIVNNIYENVKTTVFSGDLWRGGLNITLKLHTNDRQ